VASHISSAKKLSFVYHISSQIGVAAYFHLILVTAIGGRPEPEFPSCRSG